MPKKDKPETPRQAQTWQNTRNKYEDAGLCGGCAAQAAYGHQMGFHRIKPPCAQDRGKVLPLELIDRHGDRGARWLQGEFVSPHDEEVTR